MRNHYWITVFLSVGLLLAPTVATAQTGFYVDVPSGESTNADGGDGPAVTIVANDWTVVDGFGALTGDSLHSPETGAYAEAGLETALLEIQVDIPEEGEWYLWASYNFPYPDANTIYVLNANNEYISSVDGPSVDPAPFLDLNAGSFGPWLWGGAAGDPNAVDDASVGASLGTLPAGPISLFIYTADTFENVSGGSGSGADPDPTRNPHIEMLYLSSASDDVPSDAEYLATRPYSAERTMTPPVYPGFGGPIEVTITVAPEAASGGAVTITETVNSAIRIANVATSTGTASAAGSTITWDIPALSGSATLTYEAVIPSGRADTFRFVGGGDEPVGGQSDIGLLDFFIFETFAFPLNNDNSNEGQSLANLTEVLGGGSTPLDKGWADEFWTVDAGVNDSLDLRIIDNGLVSSQPQDFNPGNFSLKIDGPTGDNNAAVRRSIEPVNFGEVWISFTFVDEGSAESHFAGYSLYDNEGTEVSFVGKPWNSENPGIGNLPGGDSLAEGLDFGVPNHYLVRYVLDPNPGQNDSVYLWINPDESDRYDTYDAGGEANDDITNITEMRLRRGGGGGSAWYDNIFITSVPALLPADSGRVDLKLNDPARPDELPAWDVISVDQLGDSQTGPPYGHDNGDNHYLVVSGYIYFANADGSGDQLVGYGLPLDRLSGLNGHILGPFNNQEEEEGLRNSMKFEGNDEQDGPFTFDVVPAGQYAELRAIMTVANGDGELLATFNYEDGTTSEGVFHADDWYNDPPNVQFDDIFQLVNGMNRLGGDNSFDGRFNPAVFENAAAVDPTKTLVSVTLSLDTDGESSVGGSIATNPGYNLFSIVAIPESAIDTSVSDWSLF